MVEAKTKESLDQFQTKCIQRFSDQKLFYKIKNWETLILAIQSGFKLFEVIVTT